MMVGTPMDDPFSLEDFSISFEDDLSPLPHEDDGRKATHPLLARRLWSLMRRAACHVIPPLSAKPDSAHTDELEAISAAARHWRVGSVALTERLWTRTGPYWRGEIARTLVSGPHAAAQGFLLLLVNSVTPRALLSGRGAPLAVRDGMTGQIATQGPHLALITCETEPTGQAVASHGFTQPVVSARCFMPVDSSFERDVLLLLLQLQVALDVHGVDCAITRPFDEMSQTFPPSLQLSFGIEGGTQHELVIGMSDTPHAARSAGAGRFILSPSQLSDGSFLDWLETQIKARLQGP